MNKKLLMIILYFGNTLSFIGICLIMIYKVNRNEYISFISLFGVIVSFIFKCFMRSSKKQNCIKRNIGIILIIFYLLLLFVTTGMLFSMFESDNLSEKNTIEYSATIKETKIVNSVIKKRISLFTNEYSNLFYINDISQIDDDYVIGLGNGAQVVFRIETKKANKIDGIDPINIVSLKTNEKEVYSLYDYKKNTRKQLMIPKIIGIFILLYFIFAVIYYIVMIIRLGKTGNTD